MRPFLLILLLSTPALGQCYTDVDLMADQVRWTRSNLEFSPRITLGYQHEDAGARVRYWHLDTSLDQDTGRVGSADRFAFDVVDVEAHKQVDGIRLYGGLRTGYLTFVALAEPLLDLPVDEGSSTAILGPTAGVGRQHANLRQSLRSIRCPRINAVGRLVFRLL